MWTAVFFSLLSFIASAESNSRLVYASAGGIDWVLNDKANPGQVLIKEHGGELVQVRLEDAKVITRYENRCSFAGSYSSELEWASPVLISVNKTCVVKDDALVSGAEHPVPRNAYAMSFLSRSEGRSYFLVNVGPGKKPGAVFLKTVLGDGKAELRELVSEVPGYSGPIALTPGGRAVIYTEATGKSFNQVYRIPAERLLALITSGASAKFSDLAQKAYGFPGLSLWVSVGASGELFGDMEGAFLIQKGERRSLKVPEDCAVVGLNEVAEQTHAVLLCAKSSVRVQSLATLIAE